MRDSAKAETFSGTKIDQFVTVWAIRALLLGFLSHWRSTLGQILVTLYPSFNTLSNVRAILQRLGEFSLKMSGHTVNMLLVVVAYVKADFSFSDTTWVRCDITCDFRVISNPNSAKKVGDLTMLMATFTRDNWSLLANNAWPLKCFFMRL